MAKYPLNDTLVALFKDKNDYLIAQNQRWYRIPTTSRLPAMVQDGSIRYIAFYFKKSFDNLKYSIRQYASVVSVTRVSRRNLLPDQPYHPKADQLYYKISFGPLEDLPKPILSHRGRQILFIPTTFDKLIRADEINDVFADSPLEDRLWKELKRNNLPAERQFFLKTNQENWICDFALFCKKGNINVECDGDEHHMKPEQVIYDKNRNNQISAVADWTPLRFTTKHLYEEMPKTILTIKRKIDKLGGLHYAQEDTYRYVSKQDGQLGLFE